METPPDERRIWYLRTIIEEVDKMQDGVVQFELRIHNGVVRDIVLHETKRLTLN